MTSEQAPTPSTYQEGDTTLALKTPVPYSSDGPTLPIIGGLGEHEGTAAVNGALAGPEKSKRAEQNPDEEGMARKKQKLGNGDGDGDVVATDPPQRESKNHVGPLYKPWTLLPPEILKVVGIKRGGEDWWEQNCVSVVITKNSNMKSGVNRLKAHLGYDRHPKSTTEVRDKLRNDDVVIAVSAQGEATVKLVGVMEMAKRIVKPDGKANDGDANTKITTWYTYTSLASQVVEKMGKTQHGGVNKVDEPEGEGAMDPDDDGEFETMRANGEELKGEVKSRREPVLTIWMCRESISEFKTALGEQAFEVLEMEEQG